MTLQKLDCGRRYQDNSCIFACRDYSAKSRYFRSSNSNSLSISAYISRTESLAISLHLQMVSTINVVPGGMLPIRNSDEFQRIERCSCTLCPSVSKTVKDRVKSQSNESLRGTQALSMNSKAFTVEAIVVCTRRAT